MERTIIDLQQAIEALTNTMAGPDRWQAAMVVESDAEPTTESPAGYVPDGPWEPIGASVRNGRVGGGPEDMEPVPYWRRPLRKIRG